MDGHLPGFTAVGWIWAAGAVRQERCTENTIVKNTKVAQFWGRPAPALPCSLTSAHTPSARTTYHLIHISGEVGENRAAPLNLYSMSENPYTPNPNQGAPQPDPQPSAPAGAYAAPQQPYGAPYPGLQQPEGKKPKNVVGLVALGLGIAGFILACIPGVMILGWILLFAAFVTAIVGFFQKGKEKVSSIVALVLSIIGSIVSTVVLIVFVANTVSSDPEFEQALKDLESALATPTAVASVEAGAASSESAAESSAADASSAAPTATTLATAAPVASSAPSTEASQQTNSASSDVPRDYSNALSTANRYLSIMDFSYAGLYEQLTSEYGEKFSPEAAQYAMDNLNADWNAEALGSAQNYIDIMPFSYAGLYDQLTSEYGEQFTPEQAQYAVDNVKADWNAEALESARNYLDTMDMSTDRLYDQLISEYGEKFTPEQAQYAIDNL